jgi:hypothetical protein
LKCAPQGALQNSICCSQNRNESENYITPNKTKYKAKTPLNPESRIKRRLIVIAINLLSWSLSKEKTSWLFNGLLNQPISL